MLIIFDRGGYTPYTPYTLKMPFSFFLFSFVSREVSRIKTIAVSLAVKL
jgi:hypothetical protein